MTTDVANALVGFDTNSLIATVDDGKLYKFSTSWSNSLVLFHHHREQ